MTYRQELAREKRIQDGIAASLKYAFNNNMSSIKSVYRYLYGSGKGFESFWKKCGGNEIPYRTTGPCKLYDEGRLLELFKEDMCFRKFIKRNRINSWDILVYRAEENHEETDRWRLADECALYYV